MKIMIKIHTTICTKYQYDGFLFSSSMKPERNLHMTISFFRKKLCDRPWADKRPQGHLFYSPQVSVNVLLRMSHWPQPARQYENNVHQMCNESGLQRPANHHGVGLTANTVHR